MNHEYTILKSPSGTLNLHRDGKGCLCPKTLILMPVVNAMSQQSFQPIQMPCSTACPFASVEARSRMVPEATGGGMKDMGEGMVFTTECEGRTKEFWLTEAADKKEDEPKGKILSIH